MAEKIDQILEYYTDWTANTCASLETEVMDNVHMLFGMITEVGEIIDVFKKAIAYGKSVDWVNVEEELGDLMFYVASFCRINHIDLRRVLLSNVEKLEARYPDKFSADKALNRDLPVERSILETNISRSIPKEEPRLKGIAK